MTRVKDGEKGAARKDGRKPMLVYLRPEMIRDLKKAGVDAERHVYEIAEDAFSAWLAENAPRTPER